MPRPIVLSNGRLYVGIDRKGTVRELCWPNVGYPNHLVDGGIRLGVWVDGEFSWLDSGEWEVEQAASSGFDQFQQEFSHRERRLVVKVTDALADCDFLRRSVTVRNEGSEPVDLRFYQSHDLHIDESDIGDTAYFDPDMNGIVHYKNRTWIGFVLMEEVRPEYSCGVKRWEGMEGTWRDAEDGHLVGKAIEQGRVDSVMGIHRMIDGGGTWSFELGVGVGSDRMNLLEIKGQGVRGSLNAGALREVEDGQDPLIEASRKFVMTQVDHEGGVLAACDSDIMETARANYNYVWFRDGALVGNTLAETGHRDRAQRFWEFFLRCVGDREWAFQKYTVRGEVGASWMPWVVDGEPVVPFQQDESALPIWLGLRWGLEGGRETCERFLNHMVEYRDTHGLPGQSWDLWEERRGVHFWTTATVIEALFAGAEAGFDRADEYRKAGEKMVAAIREHFWDNRYGCLARTLVPDGSGRYEKDVTPDASILLGLMHGRLGEVEGWLAGMVERTENELAVRSSIGGIARYPGDYYFRRSEEYPGNPWVICTLWLARAKMLLAESVDEAEAIAKEAFDWCLARAETTYVLAEQFHPETGEPLSVSPLTWSHAEVLDTAMLLDRLKGGRE